MKDQSKSLLLGLWQQAMYHPSMSPDIERGDVVRVLKKALKLEGVTEEELKFDPYEKRKEKP